MIAKHCIQCGKRVEWVILGTNLALFVMKTLFALISQSRSLFADALESLANSIITVVVLVGLHIASRKADKKYPYGYGKVEFLVAAIVNVVLMFAAAYFIIISLTELIMIGPERPPGLIAIVAAIISIVVNHVAFKYGRCAGEQLGSTAIMANATVSRADVGTSVAVIVAVIGSNMGFAKCDHIVAVIIGILIVKVAVEGALKAVKGLMDVSMRKEEQQIRDVTESIEGVHEVRNVRARLVGREIRVDLDVLVPQNWALSRGLEVVREIKKMLAGKMAEMGEVSVQLCPAGSVTHEPTAARNGITETGRTHS